MTTGEPEVRRVHEYIGLRATAGGGTLVCLACGTDLADGRENYKLRVERRDVPVSELGQLFQGMESTVREVIARRAFHCPACGQRLDTEIAPATAEPLWDLQLDLDGGGGS